MGGYRFVTYTYTYTYTYTRRADAVTAATYRFRDIRFLEGQNFTFWGYPGGTAPMMLHCVQKKTSTFVFLHNS